MSVGVVIGRFQVASLHEGHIAILSEVLKRSGRLVVLVGCSEAVANAHDPLPFFCRDDAIKTVFPMAHVLPLPDQRSDIEWSGYIDGLLKQFERYGPITIFGGRDSCIPHYHGCYKTEALPVESSISGTQIREASQLGYSLDFRLGMVEQAQRRFPTSFQTIDICVCRAGSVLLGLKAAETKLRFPGGFVDPSDPSLEAAARRELKEECGDFEVSTPQYIGSARIDDWRYRDSVDGVMTAMFVTQHVYGVDKAGDDLARTVWIPREKLYAEIHPIHKPLVDLLDAHWKKEEADGRMAARS